MQDARAIAGPEGPYSTRQLGHSVEEDGLGLRRADAAEQGQLDGKAERIDAERQPEQAHFEAPFPAGGDARDAEQIHLAAGATR